MNNPIAFKTSVQQACLKQIEERIYQLEERLKTLMESKESETKSSMGDKYETGATMIQIDEEKTRQQLGNNQAVKLNLQQLKLDSGSPQIHKGSLVLTDSGVYFVGIGLGKILVEGQACFCVSPEAPVGQAMIGCQAGDAVHFNGRAIKIQEVY